MLAKFVTNASGIIFSWRDDSSFRCYTLGPLCLWQCLLLLFSSLHFTLFFSSIFLLLCLLIHHYHRPFPNFPLCCLSISYFHFLLFAYLQTADYSSVRSSTTNFPSIMISVLSPPPLFFPVTSSSWKKSDDKCFALDSLKYYMDNEQWAYQTTTALLVWLFWTWLLLTWLFCIRLFWTWLFLIHYGDDQCPLSCQPLFHMASFTSRLGIFWRITLSGKP